MSTKIPEWQHTFYTWWNQHNKLLKKSMRFWQKSPEAIVLRLIHVAPLRKDAVRLYITQNGVQLRISYQGVEYLGTETYITTADGLQQLLVWYTQKWLAGQWLHLSKRPSAQNDQPTAVCSTYAALNELVEYCNYFNQNADLASELVIPINIHFTDEDVGYYNKALQYIGTNTWQCTISSLQRTMVRGYCYSSWMRDFLMAQGFTKDWRGRVSNGLPIARPSAAQLLEIEEMYPWGVDVLRAVRR